MKRWLILTQYYPPEPGAPQIRLHTLAKELKRRGIDVTVLTGMPNYPQGIVHDGYKGRWFLREKIDGIPVVRLWLYPASGKRARDRLANYLSFTASAMLCLPFIGQYDMIFLESQPISLGVVGVAAKVIRGIPYIYNIPDLQVSAAREMGFMGSETLLRLAEKLENFFMGKAWKVSTLTHRFIQEFERRGFPREQITFLPNGVDSDVLRPLPFDTGYARKLNLPMDKKIFVYAGTHAVYHGTNVIIESARLLAKREDILFVLVGDGPARREIEELSKGYRLSNVCFRTPLFPFEEISQLMSTAVAALVTIRDIPVARQMRLAKTFPPLACGVPVIYSGNGETADLVQQHDCGIVVPPEDPERLAEAVTQLADNPLLARQLGKRGRMWVKQEYTWSAIVDRWLKELAGSENNVRGHLSG